MAYFLALLSAGFYGAADFTGGIATRRAATIPVVLISQAAGRLLGGMALGVAAIVLLSVSPSPTVRASDRPSGLGPALLAGLGVGLFLLALAQTHREAGLWPLFTDVL